MGTQRIDIIINGKNSLSSALKSAAGDVKKLGTDAKTAGTGLTQMGTKGKEASNKLKTGLGSVKSILGELKTGFSSLGGVMSSVLAGFTFAEMVQSAGDVESKWNRIAVQTGKTGAELVALKSTIRDISNYYGISNGELSGVYENAVRFYGASDDTLNKVKGIAATSKLTGKSVEEIYNAFVSGELGRNRQLQKSVLTEEQRNKYLADGKITQDEINQILQENQDTVARNPALINDTNSAYARMENAINKIKNSLGNSLLPVMEKLADIITWAGDKFSWLDKQTGGWLSTITAVGIALMALGAPLALVWGPVSKILGGFKDIGKKIKDFVLPSTKTVKVNCIKDKNCVVGDTSTSGGVTGKVTDFLWKVAPAAMTAAAFGGRALAQYGLTTVGGAFSAFGGALGPAVGGLFLPGNALGRPLTEAEKNVPKVSAEQMHTQNKLSNQGIGAWWNSWSLKDLLPGTSSAAGGGGGNKGFMNDVFGKNGLLDFSRFIPDFKWPNVGQILNGILDWVRSKVPNLKWPSVGQIWGGISKFIPVKIPKLSWPNISWGSVSAWVQSKIGHLRFPSISWGSISSWVQNHIGWLHFPQISWGSVAAWIQSKIPPFHWPSGPGGFVSGLVNRATSMASNAVTTIKNVTAPYSPWWGPGDFTYEGYGGSRKSISETIGCLSGNCVDGTLAQMSIASAFGIPSEMIATTWNGGPHVYARIAGRTRDIANHALTGSWSAPPRGPGGAGNMIVIQGDVYGFDDFKRKVEQANNQLVRW